MDEYKINMELLKARLFDGIMEVYLNKEDSCPNYEWVIAQAVSTVTNIQKYGFDMNKNPFTKNPFVDMDKNPFAEDGDK